MNMKIQKDQLISVLLCWIGQVIEVYTDHFITCQHRSNFYEFFLL